MDMDAIITPTATTEPALMYQSHGDTILIEGVAIPLIEVGFETPTLDPADTQAHLVLDHRFGLTIPKATLDEMAWWLANLVAVAQGHPSHTYRPETIAYRESQAAGFAELVRKSV